MDAINTVNPDTVRVMDQIYFAAGISVIVLGGIGTVLMVLGVLKIKFLKPFKNKYPFEKYGSFAEFAAKKPAKPDDIPVSKEVSEVQMQNQEKLAGDTERLTWENAPSGIEQLTAKELKSIKKNNENETPTTKHSDTLSENVEQTKELSVD